MQYNFRGIGTDNIMLLEMNRFNNNKPFYEEHKKEINEGVRQQLGALTLDLADALYEIDENMLVNPKKVSRIRRDTRFTKDKTLYRANVWVIWHRALEDGEMAPGLWCEVTPAGVDNGVGFWGSTPSFMDFFRKDLLADATAFLEAFVPLVEAGYGFSSYANRYKRDKPGTEQMPEVLRPVFNMKELYFVKSTSELGVIADASFVEYMKKELQIEKGMYDYLDGLYKRFKALQSN